MQTLNASFLVAVVQAAPVFMDRDATIDKACELILEAGRQGARLVAFPESFVPGYPEWVWAVAAGEERILNELYAEFLANAVTIPSDPLDKLCRIARRAKTYVVLGVTERNVEASGTSLYNTLVYIDAQGQILGKHRKLVPTGGERLVWTQGDGSTLDVYNTSFGKIGGLICWENYMPLARYALYAWGVQIYIAATWDRGEPWLSTLRHIAKEGRMFVLSPCIALRREDIPDRYSFKHKVYNTVDGWINVGESAIVNPDGEFIAGPVRMKEEILYAEIDPQQLRGPKWMLDVAGQYARPDVFQLSVNRQPHQIISQDEGTRNLEWLDGVRGSARGI
jgi:nitrilase